MSHDVDAMADALRRVDVRLSLLSERMESRLAPVEKDLGLIHEDLRLIRRDLAELLHMVLTLKQMEGAGK